MAAETIAAIATPPGFGGIGVVRVSGKDLRQIAESTIGRLPQPRLARLAWFQDSSGEPLDQGIALFFPAPHSFTGENVLEFQCHGGPVILDLLLKRILGLGARLARPGEFSERAFLNGKLDLTQAEAIADLIESGTESAARLAGKSLQGEFSRQINSLMDELIPLRTIIEATLDFPDEDIDFLAASHLAENLNELLTRLELLIGNARQGCLIQEGIQVVIAGPPNVGKSSLLNVLCGTDTAIVTAIPGTTRDLLHQEIQLDGLRLRLTDTAGLRHTDDLIEIEGIRRAQKELNTADIILWLIDDTNKTPPGSNDPGFPPSNISQHIPLLLVRNKIDLSGRPSGLSRTETGIEIAISAREGKGLDELRNSIKELVGFREITEGAFLARRRHLDALERAHKAIHEAIKTHKETGSTELTAEELRLAHQALGEITGKFTTDDLLGRIFTNFCIGK